MTKARVIGLSLGIVLILGAFGIVLWQSANMPTTGVALAQGAATATPGAGAQATPAPQQQQKDSQNQQIGDAFWTLLAGKLGVSADDLKAKAVEARKEMIDQAVKDGRVTQEQADAIKARIDANDIIAPISLGGFGSQRKQNTPGGNQRTPNTPGGNQHTQPQQGQGNGAGPFGNRRPGGMFGFGGMGANLQELNAVAGALKLEPKALVEQLSQGKTLADVAKAQGVDEATVKQAIIEYRTSQIDQLVALGVLSEVQANALKARLTPDNIDLSRGFRFNFRNAPGQQDSSHMMPDFGMGEGFQFSPQDMQNMFGQMFGGANGGSMQMPQGNLQTQ